MSNFISKSFPMPPSFSSLGSLGYGSNPSGLYSSSSRIGSSSSGYSSLAFSISFSSFFFFSWHS